MARTRAAARRTGRRTPARSGQFPPGTSRDDSGTLWLAGTRSEEVIQGEVVLVTGHDEQEEQEKQAWNHVFVKWVQRLLEKVAKGHDNQHDAKSQEGLI